MRHTVISDLSVSVRRSLPKLAHRDVYHLRIVCLKWTRPLNGDLRYTYYKPHAFLRAVGTISSSALRFFAPALLSTPSHE